jgi:diguanylate cyclase (GGDEF)-like protein
VFLARAGEFADGQNGSATVAALYGAERHYAQIMLERTTIIVDDDPATRRLLQRQLELAGFNVRAFADGRAAVEPITELGTGIVIADWHMPEMDGIELCQAVRELESMQALGTIYYILLTANNNKEQIVEGLAAGANDYLTKPYHQGELLARIQVGERVLRLQEELRKQTVEFQKANLELTLLSRKLDDMANTDALTGLSNRRCLLRKLKEAWDGTTRNNQSLSCIMFDIDKFKRINDTYGHEAGDEVLKATATRLRASVRRPDMCGRLGGEEFALVCAGLERDAAAAVAERIRNAIAAKPVRCGEQDVAVTTSCGVAQRDAATDSPEALLRHADDMLYAAKEHGRNQTWVRQADGNGTAFAPADVSRSNEDAPLAASSKA